MDLGPISSRLCLGNNVCFGRVAFHLVASHIQIEQWQKYGRPRWKQHFDPVSFYSTLGMYTTTGALTF